ncbi:MAG: hypothetical protein WC119_02345 [Synergistaceae bacterium]
MSERDLTPEEESKLLKIMNDDSSSWTTAGYSNGVLCEDAATPSIVYTPIAEKTRKSIEKAVELQKEIELAKQQGALKMALANFDADLLQKAKELSRKYEAMVNSYSTIKLDYEEMSQKVSELRKRRNYLRSQEKKLGNIIKELESKVATAMELSMSKIDEAKSTIRSLEI